MRFPEPRPASSDPATVVEPRDRAEISGALYRLGLGLDRKDRELFVSALAADAELDVRPAARAWGGRPPLLSGRDTIVTVLLELLAERVDSTHRISDEHITASGDTARLTALVEAHHRLSDDHAVEALLKNRCEVTLLRDGRAWVIGTMWVASGWYRGDPAACFDCRPG